jgi:hypothetical protein
VEEGYEVPEAVGGSHHGPFGKRFHMNPNGPWFTVPVTLRRAAGRRVR